MLDLLRYFGHDDEVNAMRKAPESERARMWREFYAETDPNNITPENEALNQYFSRIAQANQRFTDEGVPGWRTDRGEVFVNLGPPDEAVENSPGTTANRILRWTYINLPPGALLPGRERLRAPAAAAEQPGRLRADAGAAAAAGRAEGDGGAGGQARLPPQPGVPADAVARAVRRFRLIFPPCPTTPLRSSS